MSTPATPAASAADSVSPAPAPARTPASARLVCLDALRGFDMFWILGADALMQALGEVSSSPVAKFLAGQLDHRAWAGMTFYDLIFPLFIFISGASLVYSLTRQIEQHGRVAAARRVAVRGLILFVIGIFYSGGFSSFWPDIRLLGVLQRIALAYTGAGLLFCFLKPRGLVAAAVLLLAGYWALLTFAPIRDIRLQKDALATQLGVPKPPIEQVRAAYAATTARVRGHYEPGYNVTNHFDFEHLPGRLYDSYFDPEGYLSTLPAIATCLGGVFAGLLMRRRDITDTQKLRTLVLGGAAAVALGWLWHLQFPVIKKLWTSSYVLVAAGYSAWLLALFFYVVDVRQWRRWCTPFLWIGMNAITLYLANNIIKFRVFAQRFVGGDIKVWLDAHIGAGAGQGLIAIVALGFTFILARFLYRRQIFLRV